MIIRRTADGLEEVPGITGHDVAWLWAMVAQAACCACLEVAGRFLTAVDLAMDLDDPTSPLSRAAEALEDALQDWRTGGAA